MATLSASPATKVSAKERPAKKERSSENHSLKDKPKEKVKDKKLKRKREIEGIEALEAAVAELDLKATPPPENFTDLPLSDETKAGLRESHFMTLTDIQARAIPTALKGSDILGAAKTGSGKTLAFLVPVMEKLYRARWTKYDGLGALIISPTRELSEQIFEVLSQVGKQHGLSAGIVTGGKSSKEEAAAVGRMNILVCTPGRMLHHLDQTANLVVDNLQILVLDEADRIMDLGFQKEVDALVQHLPRERQTLLFSATQTKKVSDLARLSLREPAYISVHEAAEAATPSQLQQHYLVTPLPEKLDTLYGFIKSNLRHKMVVFFSSGKQVRFAYEAFRHLRPGIPLLQLYGRQKPAGRLATMRRFAMAKQACLFATDLAARGVDIPMVEWVVQVDCPEDAETYIHRSGRTARYDRPGRAVLFLDPSEEAGMLARLAAKKVPIRKINVREKKKQTIVKELQNMCYQRHDVKTLAQRAYSNYARSVHLQKDKTVFQLDKLDLSGFAASMGLTAPPPLQFKPGFDAKVRKNAPREADKEAEEPKKVTQPLDANADADDDGEGDFFSAKRVLDDEALAEAAAGGVDGEASGVKVLKLGGARDLVVDSKRREKLLQSKKQLLKFKGTATKLVFDEAGEAHAVYELQDEAAFRQQGAPEAQRQQYVQTEAERAAAADGLDKQQARERRREKRLKRKQREREEAAEARGEAYVPRDQDEEEEEEEDPLALLRSLPLAEASAQKGGHKDSDEETEKPRKKKRRLAPETALDSLDDLEAMATGLLED